MKLPDKLIFSDNSTFTVRLTDGGRDFADLEKKVFHVRRDHSQVGRIFCLFAMVGGVLAAQVGNSLAVGTLPGNVTMSTALVVKMIGVLARNGLLNCLDAAELESFRGHIEATNWN